MNKFLAGAAVGIVVSVDGLFCASKIVENDISQKIKLFTEGLREQVVRKIEPDSNS